MAVISVRAASTLTRSFRGGVPFHMPLADSAAVHTHQALTAIILLGCVKETGNAINPR